MMGASVETTLELWASSLRDVKARMRGLFTERATEPTLAVEMINRATANGVPFSRVAADAVRTGRR